MENTEEFYLTKAPIKKLLFKFAVPCVLGMLVSALYNIVDQIFIGRSVGYLGNAATTVVFPFTVIVLAIALLIGDGCAALFSISLGAKDEKTSEKCVGNALIISIISGIILMILGFVFKNYILNIFGVTDASFDYANSYMKIILIGIPFYMFTSTVSSIIRADGAPGYSMVATVIGAILNLILDPIFIFVLNMGVEGAAIATVIGQAVSMIFCAIYFIKPKLIKLSKQSFKLDKKIIFRICKLGMSSFITQISIAVITCVANNVIVAVNSPVYGQNIPLSALGIVFKIFGIVIAFCIGIAVGGQPIIGYNYGAKKYDRVFETYKLVIISNIIVGIIATIIFQAFPQIIVSLFGNESDLYNNYACMSFRIYLGGILFCCIQKASCIFMQSIDKPYKAMTLSLMRDVLFLVPGVCLLAFLGDVEKMLLAGPIADVLAFIFTIIFVVIECKKLKKSITLKEEILDKKEEQKLNGFVISIGREFGSGGKYIGEELAKRFNVKCYDKELLEKVSKDYNIDLSSLEKVDEKQKSSFWYSFATNYTFSDDKNSVLPISAEDSLFLKQAKVIEELYDNESCIIIGRCSDFILKNKQNVISIFLYASDMEFKINRKKEFEKISYKEASKKIEKIDEQRSNYYNKFTGNIWGDKENYEMCIDVSKVGIEETIQVVENYIKYKLNK